MTIHLPQQSKDPMTHLISPALTRLHLTVTAAACGVLFIALISVALAQGGLLIAFTAGLLFMLHGLPPARTRVSVHTVTRTWTALTIPAGAVMISAPVIGSTHPLIWLIVALTFIVTALLLRAQRIS